ncbi:MAG: S53 family peptidase [Chloroflexota bacterium]
MVTRPAIRRLFCAALLGVLPLAASIPATGAVATGSQFHGLFDARQSASSDSYTPAQIEAAYNIAPLQQAGVIGTGQTIGLVEFDSFRLADIHRFDAANQLPDPAIQKTYVGGSSFALAHSGEATMDLEWAHAMAPGAALHVYFIDGNESNRAGWKSVAQAVAQAVTDGDGAMSMSFGACKPDSGYQVLRNALATARTQGLSVFVSSGDSGAFPGPKKTCGKSIGVSYPGSDPSVVSVGGTSLLLNTDGSIASESAWALSGGGKGKPLTRPAWQVAPQLHTGKYRWVPDVSFLADVNTGVEVFYHGRWVQAGGTSLGAPAWAGIWSLLRQSAQSAGKALPAAPATIYQIANSPAYLQSFHDIVTGDNGKYLAGPGWDPVTGWGTPNVAGLVATITGTVAPAPAS